MVTDPTDVNIIYEDRPTLPDSEQGSSFRDSISSTSDNVREILDSEDTEIGSGNKGEKIPNVDENSSAKTIQNQLSEQFLDAFANLSNPEKDKEANTIITYCLNRLFKRDELREKALELLDKIPWRSEAVTQYLAQFKDDAIVIRGLTEFVNNHQVYYWHRANALEALAKISGPNSVSRICRAWLSDESQSWYPKVVASRLLMDVARQHSFLVECLRREQSKSNSQEKDILKQQLAYAAFMTAKAKEKHITLFDIVLNPQENVLLRRLVIYLLQQPNVALAWDDIKAYQPNLSEFSHLIQKLGISSDIQKKPCYISQILKQYFEVNINIDDLRPYYLSHYEPARKHLRKAIEYFYISGDDFVRNFHQFAQLTLLAFHQSVLPNVVNSVEYGSLWQSSDFKKITPLGDSTWEKLGMFRNQIDHPINKITRMHNNEIKATEAELLKKQLKVALQELYQAWIVATPPTPSPVANVTPIATI